MNTKDLYEKYLRENNIPYMRDAVSIPYIDTYTGKLSKTTIPFILLTDPPQWVDTAKRLKPTDWRIAIIRHTSSNNIIYRSISSEEWSSMKLVNDTK